MPPLQVKDCPEDVYERLRACAKRENRSISQQTLTMIEYYLSIYEPQDTLSSSTGWRLRPKDSHRSIYAGDDPLVDYLSPRREVLARIRQHKPAALSVNRPLAHEVLAQIRKEEAR